MYSLIRIFFFLLGGGREVGREGGGGGRWGGRGGGRGGGGELAQWGL